jgi:hypothetical protein
VQIRKKPREIDILSDLSRDGTFCQYPPRVFIRNYFFEIFETF